MRTRGWVALLVALSGAVTQAQVLRVKVGPECAPDGKLTGRYVARVVAEQAPTARRVTLGLTFPTPYGLANAPVKVGVAAVRPGADVARMDIQEPPTPGTADDTPILVVELAPSATGRTLWLSALLNDDPATADKRVCDILFTSRGRCTTTPVVVEPASASVTDKLLAVLTENVVLDGTACPVLGDLNWDGRVTTLDFAWWLKASRQGGDLRFADIFPLASGEPADPASAVSRGDNAVDGGDFTAWLQAWRASSVSAAATDAGQGGAAVTFKPTSARFSRDEVAQRPVSLALSSVASGLTVGVVSVYLKYDKTVFEIPKASVQWLIPVDRATYEPRPDGAILFAGPKTPLAGGATFVAFRLRKKAAVESDATYTVAFRRADPNNLLCGPDVSVLPATWGSLAVQVGESAATSTVVSGLSVQSLGSRGVSITYTLSGPASVSARVLNLAGRLVRQLAVAQAAPAGLGTLAWSLETEQGTAACGGSYLVVVEAEADDGQRARVVQPFVISR